jgi:hypothetical protein
VGPLKLSGNDRFRDLSRIAARKLLHMQNNAASATWSKANVGKVRKVDKGGANTKLRIGSKIQLPKTTRPFRG